MLGLAATVSASLACGFQRSVTLGDDGEVSPGRAVGGDHVVSEIRPERAKPPRISPSGASLSDSAHEVRERLSRFQVWLRERAAVSEDREPSTGRARERAEASRNQRDAQSNAEGGATFVGNVADDNDLWRAERQPRTERPADAINRTRVPGRATSSLQPWVHAG